MDIVDKYSNLVYKIAHNYKGLAELEDLCQVGYIGLLRALNNYNQSSKAKFSSYAYFYINGEMNKLVRHNKPLKVSDDISLLASKIDKVISALAQELGRYPTNIEVANYLNVSLSDYEYALNSINCVDNFDSEIKENITLYDLIGSKMDIDSMIDLKNKLDQLPEQDRKIIMYRYMYDMTQSEISEKLGINQVGVSRHEQKVLTKLREELR